MPEATNLPLMPLLERVCADASVGRLLALRGEEGLVDVAAASGLRGPIAAALLLRHEFGVIDRGINLFEALAHVPLEAGGQIYVLERITDAGGAGLERRTVAGEGSHLIRAHARLSGLALLALGL